MARRGRRPARRALVLLGLLGTVAAPMAAQPEGPLPAMPLPEVPVPATDYPGPPYIDTTRPAVPGAQEVLRDVPSALHPTRQQRGELSGYPYVLFPDGRARVLYPGPRPRSAAELTCYPGDRCDIRLSTGEALTVGVGRGALPDLRDSAGVPGVARYLAQWMLAGTAPPEPEPAPVPAPDPAPADPQPEGDGDLDATVADGREAGAPDATQTAPVRAGSAPTATPGPLLSSTDPRCIAPDRTMPDACALAAPAQAEARPQPARPTAPERAQLTLPAPPDAEPSLWARYDVSCSVTASAGLSGLTSSGNGGERGVAKPRASFGCEARLAEGVTLRLSLVGYLNPSQQKQWDPDYTYALTWRASDSLSLSYSNYGARFTGSDGPLADLLDGTLRASYRLPALNLPEVLGEEKTLPCSASLGLPRPDRTAFSLSCSYAVTDKLRLGGTTHLYLAGAQDTYQPDYTYTASYRINDDWTVSYQNYSNNRFAWNRGEAPGPGFTGGSLSVTYRTAF